MKYRLKCDCVLKFERLSFRAFTADNNDNMCAIQSNLKMVDYTPHDAWKEEQDWYNFFGFVSTFYDEKRNGVPIGSNFSLLSERKAVKKPLACANSVCLNITVFYGISPECWGRSYATKSAKPMLKFGFDELKHGEIVEENYASGRVLEKAGLIFDGKLENISEEFSYFEGEPLLCNQI